jgi:hypothetical protein
MKYLKILGLAAVAAMAMMAFTAGSASATTLEVNGVTTNDSVTITASLKPKTVAVLRDTAGFSKNECSESHAHGVTEVYTGTYVSGPLTGHTHAENTAGIEPSSGLSFGGCTRPVTVERPGTLLIDWISGTNGTVTSKEAIVKVGSAIGTLNCNTGEGTDIGTLTGVASGHATMDINGVINCGIIPSAKWEGTYIITTPTGLGVSS